MRKDLKITVVGIGGVGGYMSAMLAGTYEKVTIVARGERRKVLEQRGICLHSDFHGEQKVKPGRIVESSREIKELQDFVFLCVKNYSLEEVCKDLEGCIDEHTVIIPVMNGADTATRTEKFLKKGSVVEAVIYITSFFNEDYSITQLGKYAQVQIGTRSSDVKDKKAVEQAQNCMKDAGIDCRICQDIVAAVWEKFIFNCGYNVLTAYYMENVDTIHASEEKCREFYQLMEEAWRVARVMNIHVREGYLESEYRRFMRLDAGSTSSLKRDMEAGRKNELETFSGYLVSAAKKLGEEIPASEKMYEELKKRN